MFYWPWTLLFVSLVGVTDAVRGGGLGAEYLTVLVIEEGLIGELMTLLLIGCVE
jgi:hypothetical protein